MKVLLVEDSVASLQVTQKFVESAGHSVITANDGEQDIQKFLEHKPDLVLLDVNMSNMDVQCYSTAKPQQYLTLTSFPMIQVLTSTLLFHKK